MNAIETLRQKRARLIAQFEAALSLNKKASIVSSLQKQITEVEQQIAAIRRF